MFNSNAILFTLHLKHTDFKCHFPSYLSEAPHRVLRFHPTGEGRHRIRYTVLLLSHAESQVPK